MMAPPEKSAAPPDGGKRAGVLFGMGIALIAALLLLAGSLSGQGAGPLAPPGTPPPSSNFIDNMRESLGFQSSAVECQQPVDDLGWAKLSAISIGLCLVIAAVGYIMSGLLGTTRYNAFAKGTLVGCTEGAVILGIFLLSQQGLGEFGERNLDKARAYSTIIKNTAEVDFGMTLAASTIFSFFAKQNPQLRSPVLPGIFFGFQMAPMFRPAFDAMNMVTQMIMVSVAEWTMHEYLLCFIKTSMLTLLLPAGIFMRIYGIKRAGDAMIAIALALYFIYPWLMIIVGETLTDFFQTELSLDLATGEPHPPVPDDAFGSMDKPIRCFPPPSPKPAGWGDDFLRNGPDWETSLDQRIDQKKVLESGESLLPFDTGVGGRPLCVFSTGLSRTYNTLVHYVDMLGWWSLLAIPGAGVLATLAEYFNISFIWTILLPPVTAFAMSAIYEAMFFLFVVSIVLPIFMIFITITVAKEFAKLLGTEMDLSALEKII